ncbi:hypothetical protein [Agreia pratensis]|nr:hypothetical protein [Agreia pratensis]
MASTTAATRRMAPTGIITQFAVSAGTNTPKYTPNPVNSTRAVLR